MVKPERRTRGDVVAAIAIAAVVAVTAALVWWTSDARATISRPAASPIPTLITAKAVPVRTASVVDRGQPEDHGAAGGRGQRGHR